MAYIIDGNNLMGRKQTRLESLIMLAQFSKSARIKLSIVFDGAPELHYPEGSAYQGVKIYYSKRGSNADARICQMISKLPNLRETVVVTSDRSLAGRIKALGAKQISREEFLLTVEKVLSRVDSKKTVEKPALAGGLNEWLRYFGCEPDEADKDEFH